MISTGHVGEIILHQCVTSSVSASIIERAVAAMYLLILRGKYLVRHNKVLVWDIEFIEALNLFHFEITTTDSKTNTLFK